MAQGPTRRRTILKRGGIGVGIFVLLLVVLILLWSWDWFIPLVDARASAALGRSVSIAHLHVRLGRVTRIVADDVEVAGTPQFPDKLATVKTLEIAVEVLPLIRHRQIVLPLIDVQQPVIKLLGDTKGNTNFALKPGGSGSTSSSSSATDGPQLGVLKIEDGRVHVDDPKYKAEADITVETRNAPDPFTRPLPANQGEIVANGGGRYAGQPITVHFVGGAILSLRDKNRPYPIDLSLANGQTRVALKGTIEQPLTFGGARISLVFSGPDMSLLYPLTGVVTPQTPPYKVTGNFDYSKSLVAFRDFEGKVGNSDLGGTISAVPAAVPTVTADLHSRNVDLADLGGFVGSKDPGKADTKPAAARPAKADKSASVLPDTPINVPKLNATNVRLTYHGAHIENRNVPLDDITARLDIDKGVIDLKQLDFKVGSGRIQSSVSINPNNGMQTRAHADFNHLDLSRLMQATHAFHGQGVISGKADLVSTGNSVAKMMANGSGGVTMVMSGGGDISALLPDIAGLEIGNAILSAIGLPNRAQVQCFVVDMPLKNGIMSTNTLLLQTSEARSVGRGTIDFRDQTLDYSLTTRSTHFSIGSLPGPINITGKLNSPSIRPGTEVVARAAGATALGVLLPPLAILPTIQFGVGEAEACRTALTDVQEHPAAHGQAKGPVRTTRHTHH